MGKKILVIEDSDTIASLLKDSLESMGHRVIIATSGLEGLRRAECMKPDVITLDIMMPRLDGVQVMKELKGNNVTKDIPVIIISVAGDAYRRKGLKLGAVAFFKKPLDFNQLNKKIKSITEKKIVLVVEDNNEMLKLLEITLNSMGYNVICAVDGESAFAKAKELKPDIILMDILLPKEDGFMITTKLKEDEETAGVPVIAFSGYFSEGIDAKKIVGVDKFFEEEFSAKDLAEEVDSFLKEEA